MPRSLTSRWFRVARSGPTIDGREISKQEIIDMAETYSLDVYTANIFPEHERGWGTLGTVYALEQRPEDDGELGLYARIRPNDHFLYLNDQAQLLFGSVEITPNFMNTGRSYCTGLGATDMPASSGCQEFYFNRRVRPSPATKLYSQQNPFPKNADFTEHKAKAGLFSAVKNLCQHLGLTTKQFNEIIEETPSMTPEQLAALTALYQQGAAFMNGLGEFVNSFSDEAAPLTQEQQDAVANAQDAVDTVVAEIPEEQKEFNQKMLSNLEAITQQLASLSTTPAGKSFSKVTAIPDTPQAAKGKGAL